MANKEIPCRFVKYWFKGGFGFKGPQLDLRLSNNNIFTLDFTGAPHRLEKVSRFQRQSQVRPHCEIRIIMGFGQSISQCNFLHPGSDPTRFKGSSPWGGLKVTGLAGRVQEVAAHNTACNEYRGRQSKHNTSSSRTLSPEWRAFLSEHCTVTEVSETPFFNEPASNNKHFYDLFFQEIQTERERGHRTHNSVTRAKNNQRSALSRTWTFLPRTKSPLSDWGWNTGERMYVRAGKGHQSHECLRRTHIPFIFL